MEEKKMTEKESLELISQMIQSSKKRMELGWGNRMLYWGYFTAALSLVLYALISITQNWQWASGWLLMFVFWIIISWKSRKQKPAVVTYTDKVIKQVWFVIGNLYLITFVVISVIILIYQQGSSILMLPLSLLYAAIGVSIQGVVIQERSMIYSPVIAFIFAIYMLMELVMHHPGTVEWNLYFGISFVAMYIIPGHIMNSKSKKQCSKS